MLDFSSSFYLGLLADARSDTLRDKEIRFLKNEVIKTLLVIIDMCMAACFALCIYK